MIASRLRGQMGVQMLAPQDEVPASGGGGADTESFWSSFSVVESLFSDEHTPAPGSSNNNMHHHQPQHVIAPSSSPVNGGSRLPMYRQLKTSAPQEVPSYEAFPPLPPSPALYEDDHHGGGSGHSNHHHNGGSNAQHRRAARHSPRVGSPITNGHLSPSTQSRHGHNGNPIGNGHHHSNSNGHSNNNSNNNSNRYYDAFNGYNHLVGMSNGYHHHEQQGRSSPLHTPPMSPQTGSPFSVFSDFPQARPTVPLGVQMASSPLSSSPSSFALGPDIGGPGLLERDSNGRQSPRDFGAGGGISKTNGNHHTMFHHHQAPITKMGFNIGEKEGDALHLRLGNGSGHHHHHQHPRGFSQSQQHQHQEEDEGACSLLTALQDEHLMKILSLVSAKDLTNLQMVGKRRLAAMTTSDVLWKDLYLRRWKLPEVPPPQSPTPPPSPGLGKRAGKNGGGGGDMENGDDEDTSSDEWAWITSLLQQNERWKDIFQSRHSAERWRIGTLKMFNGCWGFISQHAPGDAPAPSSSSSLSSTSTVSGQSGGGSGGGGAGGGGASGETLDIFFHRKDIAPEGDWYEDWWLKDTPGVSRSQKCGYWDTFLCGRVVRYKQRAAYAQGRRPQACNISFVGDERRERVLPSHPDGPAVPPTRFIN